MVFLEENSLLPRARLPLDGWENFILDVLAGKIDRETTTRRLRKLLKRLRKRNAR